MPKAATHNDAGASCYSLVPPLKKIAVTALGFVLVLYCLGVGLALPHWGRPLLEKELSETLGVPCVIRQITANPFTLKLTAHGVAIPPPENVQNHAGEHFIQLERLEFIPSLRSLPKKTLVIKEVRLVHPHITLLRFKDGSLSTQFPAAKNTAATKNKEGLFPVVLHNMNVQGGTLNFRDEIHDVTHSITNINISVPFASTLEADKDVAVTPTLSASVGGKEVHIAGESRPFMATRQTEFILRTKELGLAEFRNYIAPYTRLSLQSGSLQSALLLRFALDPEHVLDIALAGTVAIEDLSLADGKMPVFSARQISLDMENVLLGPRRVVINEALLENPNLMLHRSKDGSLNWQKYFFLPENMPKSDVRITSGQGTEVSPHEEEQTQAPLPEKLPLQLVLDNVRINNGTATWRDDVPEESVSYTANNITATFTDVSTEDEGRATFDIRMGSGDSHFTVTGKATTTPLQAECAITAHAIPLAPFAPYIAESSGLRLEAGTCSVKGNLIFHSAPDKTVRFSGGEASLDGIRTRIEQDGAIPFTKIHNLRASGIAVDLASQTAHIEKISGSGVDLAITRDGNGTLVLPMPPTSRAATAPVAKNQVGKPWHITLNTVAVAASRATFTDNALKNPVVIPVTDIAITGANFTTTDKTRWTLDVSGKPGERGSLNLTAKGTLEPLNLTFSGRMERADMRAFSPYLQEATQLTLAEATLAADFSGSAMRRARNNRGGRFAVKGNLGLYGVTLLHNKRELGGWGRLRITGVDYATSAGGKQRLSVDAVTLNSPRLSVSIDRNGVSSLTRALQADKQEEHEATAAMLPPEGSMATPFDATKEFAELNVNSVTISQGQARYTDRRLSPPYSLNVDNVTVSAQKLSLDPAEQTTLTGKFLINGSPLSVTGTGSSWLTTPTGNGSVTIRSLDLSRFTRYAEKYLGYPVQSGTLELDSSVTLAGKDLSVANSILIQNLVLGKKVQSPHAPDMPLPTAVALLRDINGAIALDIPVSGTIGDPEFELGGVIGTVIGNVMLKTITSPFTLLGSIVSGAVSLLSETGPQSVEIVFPIGEDILDATARTALEELGRELYKYPSATLEVTGVADKSESTVLVEAWVNSALRRIKHSALPPEEKAKTSPEDMRVSATRNAHEYKELLFDFYQKLPFVKKATDPEITSPQSTRAIMRILRKHITIGDAELRLLAEARAKAVYHSVCQGKIDLAARIRLKEPVLVDAQTSGERIASYARITIKRR